jgi:hypothetical protein
LANKKISSLDALTSVATGDELVIVDKSDTTMAATGTTKKITQDNLIPDASATVKGKVELATDAETLAGTATTLAITPANLKSMILDEDDMASDSATKVPSQQSVKAYVDSNGGGFNQGFMNNAKIDVSVASNNLTVALKTLAGENPSASDPVKVRIGNTIHTLTSLFQLRKTLELIGAMQVQQNSPPKK